jgi:hypothetical protein
MTRYNVRADVRKLFGSKEFKVDDFRFLENANFVELTEDGEKTWVKESKILGIEEVENQ